MAGSKCGDKLFGLSLARSGKVAGGSHGAPGAAGESPISAPKMSFKGADPTRTGGPTSVAAYKGGVGSGANGGSQG